ncbi:MAG: hypothetical protein HOA16_08700, partial [Opitutae bacterium]|nr:hypothetical protein [Opitutae bacterium]
MQDGTPPKLTISLDIGHSSIGWSVLETEASLNFLGNGALTFRANDCLGSKRRRFRSSRRRIAATRRRISNMAKLLEHLGVFKGHEAEVVDNSSPWLDAARVITGIETLDWPKLWNVLRWYAHNRGYDGNEAWSKAGEQEEEEERNESDIADLEKLENQKRVKAAKGLMKKHEAKTMADTVCKVLGIKPEGKKRSTHQPEGFKSIKYAFPRRVVKDEVRTILTAHIGKLPQLDESLVKALLDDARVIECSSYRLSSVYKGGLLFGGLVPRLNNRIIPICPFTGKNTQAKRRKEFYEFRWAMVLANLTIDKRPLDAEERALVDEQIRKVGFFTKASLRNFLQKELSARDSNVETYFLTPSMEQALVFDPAKRAISSAGLDEAFEALPRRARQRIASRLNKLCKVTPGSWVEMAEDPESFRDLLAAAYGKRDRKPTLEEWLKTSLDLTRLVPSGRAPYAKPILAKAVAEVMQGKDPRHPDGCLYNPPPITDRKIDTLTNNPLIRHRLLLAERLYGSLIHHYAQGDLSRVGTIVIETTRELSEFSGKTNKEIGEIIGLREKQHKDAKKLLEENQGKNGLQYDVSSSLIRKVRIAMDTDWTCPYTGEKYDLRQIVDGEVETEHVIPRSKRESDSLNGLVLTSPEVNRRWKGNLTGYAFIKKFEGQAVPE